MADLVFLFTKSECFGIVFFAAIPSCDQSVRNDPIHFLSKEFFMKRPLCLLAVIVTAVVYLCLELFLYNSLSDHPVPPEDSSIEIVGLVSGKELKKNYTGQYLPVIYIVPRDERPGSATKIQCYLTGNSHVPSIGEYVRVSGKVRNFEGPTNPGEFDSRLYYLSLKIAYSIKNADITGVGGKRNIFRESLYRVKTTLGSALDKSLSEQDAGIMKAMLLGDKSGLDREIKDDFQNNGVIHIIAISGTHIAFLGMGLYKLLKKLKCPNVVCGLLPILVMYSYGVMCGMGSSSFRAICMFSVKMLAPLLGRTYDVLSSLALAEILLILDQPLYLYNSGFLFSFGAVLGITLVKPMLDLRIFRDDTKMNFKEESQDEKLPAGLKLFCRDLIKKASDGLKTSASITLVTLPVYAVYYHTFPVHSIFLNLFIIPLLGVLLMSGLICLVGGLLGIWLGLVFKGVAAATMGDLFIKVPALFVSFILFLYRRCCSFTGLVRGFTWYMGHSSKWQVAVYLVLLTAFVVISRTGTKKDHLRYGLLAVAMLILTFHHSPSLEINMVDVGQGDGIVLTSEGKSMLIDGGSTSQKDVGRYQIMPFLKYKGIGTLEYVVMTHEDKDHVSGIFEILNAMEKGGIRVKRLVLPEIADESRGENYRLLEARAADLKIPVLYLNSGEALLLGKAELYCLNPKQGMKTDSANEYSTTLFVKYREFTALLTGDVEGEGQDYLKSQLKRLSQGGFQGITLLKVAHHGSEYTTDAEFLNMVQPEIALISCGLDNSYGHPHQKLLKRLEDIDAKVYRTDQCGCITVEYKRCRISCTSYLKYNFTASR